MRGNDNNMSFRRWLEDADPTGQMMAQQAAPDQAMAMSQASGEFKPWRASREEIIRHWNSLRAEPVVFRTIPIDKKGSTFTEDGIRFTGTKKFIDSCLARFKDLLGYESQSTKLDVVWRQIGPKNPMTSPGELPTFVFYTYVRDRKPGQPMASPLAGLAPGEPPEEDI